MKPRLVIIECAGDILWQLYFSWQNWRMYLVVCSIPSLMAAYLYHILPETPVFLLAVHDTNRAIQTMKNYSNNNSLLEVSTNDYYHTLYRQALKKHVAIVFISTLRCIWALYGVKLSYALAFLQIE